jgi:hypothetical protein
MFYIPSLIGEFGVLVLNLLILSYLARKDNQIIEENKGKVITKQSLFKYLLCFYFIVWIIVSVFAWYSLNFIKLGEFFAISVVTPALMVLLVKAVFR